MNKIKDCKKCVCLKCDANNKLHATELLNTCYGCDGKDDKCKKTITSNDCLYALKNRIEENNILYEKIDMRYEEINMKDTNAVLTSLYEIRENYSEIVDDIYYVVNNKEYPLVQLIKEIENNTEIGNRFVIDVTKMVLVYMSKFKDEN